MPYNWAGQRGRMGLFWRVHPSCRWPARASRLCSAHFVSCYRCSHVRHRLEQVVRRSNLRPPSTTTWLRSQNQPTEWYRASRWAVLPVHRRADCQFIYAGQRRVTEARCTSLYRLLVSSVRRRSYVQRTWDQTTIPSVALRYVRPLIRSIATR